MHQALVRRNRRGRAHELDAAAQALTEWLESTRIQLRALPPKSAKSKPRYWDRDPRILGRSAVLEAVQLAPNREQERKTCDL